MVKRKGMVKKALAAVAVTAVTCSFAMSAGVAAIPTYIVKTYSGVDLTFSQNFESYPYIHGYYEIKTSDHEARSSAHVLAGNNKVDAYSSIQYLDKNTNQRLTYSGDSDKRGRVSGTNGWVMSKWLSLPQNTYSSVLGIQFFERVYDANNIACYIDEVDVNL